MTSFPVVLLLCLFPFALLSKAFATVVCLLVVFGLLPYFFVDSGGISKYLILVFDQSWGQRRIRGPPLPFLNFYWRSPFVSEI